MPDVNITLQIIMAHLIRAMEPLQRAFSDSATFQNLLFHLGWNAESIPNSYRNTANLVEEVVFALEKLQETPDLRDVRLLIDKVKSVLQTVREIQDVPEGIEPGIFREEFAERLIEWLLVEYLAIELPTVYNALEMTGVIGSEYHEESQSPIRPAYLRTFLRYQTISDLISDPICFTKSVYGWGTEELDFELLATHAFRLADALGIPVSIERADLKLGEGFQADATVMPTKPITILIRVPIFEATLNTKTVEGSIVLLELPAEGQLLPGVILQPILPEELKTYFSIDENWSVSIDGKFQFEQVFGITIRPGGEISLRFPLVEGQLATTTGFDITLHYNGDNPYLLLGDSNRTRLEFDRSFLGLALRSFQDRFELYSQFGVEKLTFILNPEDLDGFLAKLIGSSEVSIAIPFTLEWSSSTGITFGGSPGFSLETLPHLNLGPLTIERFAIEIRSSFGDNRSTDLMLAIVIALSARLGPVTASAAGLGLKLSLVFPDRDGFDVNFGYQAPNGIGLSIAAKGVTGGGLLAFEPSKHLYSGFLGLNFRDIGLSAIGLILTESPNNPNTFSLLVSIGVKFTPPLQLSMGFRLMGVGGLIGVNRSLAVEPLRAGFKNRTLDAILFPDPASFIDNSPTILSNLEQFFPNSEAQYMVGPIVKLGWGSPPIINGEIGVLMVFPDPVTVFVLGRIVATFPKKDKPLIVINLDILGMVDFAQQQLSFQASLYDSKVLDYRLEGDSAFLLGWSNDPRFALAIGGFHPAFTPPSPATIFSDLKRVSLIISAGKNLNIKCLAYQALTSNSLHFGAKINLAVSAVGFSVKGHLGFDALFCFSPFLFEIQISGGVRLEYEGLSLFGVNLDLLLAGPTPWHARGKLKIKILFFTIPLSFDKRWGLSDFSKLPSVDPKPLLLEALNNPLAWGGSLPDSQGMVEQVAGNESQNSLLLWDGSIQDLNALVNKISPSAIDSVSVFLWENFEPPIRQILTDENSTPEQLLNALVQGLNRIIQGDSLYEEARFAGVNLREETRSLIERQASGKNLLRLNRLLLEDAYPEEISRNTLILLHPLSRLEIRQNVVPLGLQLEKMGNSPVSGHDRFDLESLTIGNRNYTQSELEHLHEFFARGQYRELTGDQKLSLPSFEKMPAGAAMISESTLFDQAKTVRKPAGYKTIVIDEEDVNQPALAEVDWNWAKVSVGAKSVSLAAARAGDRATYTPLPRQPAVSFQQERYYIARASNLTLAELTINLPWQNTGLSRMCADQLLKAHLELHPEQTDELIVIPAYELAA